MSHYDAEGRELFKCGSCKMKWQSVHYDVDRHGMRRKCCIPCKDKRTGVYRQFIIGLAEKHGLALDDLDDYVYAGGGSPKYGLSYFRLKCPGESLPPHQDVCVCNKDIIYNCYIRKYNDDGSHHTLVLGNCCIKRFVPTSGRNCGDCGAPHRNRVVDRCKSCRKFKCDRCGVKCQERFKLCFRCYTES